MNVNPGDILDDLERNAKYRAEAVQPIVDELKAIRAVLESDSIHVSILSQLRETNDLIAELIRSSHWNGSLHL